MKRAELLEMARQQGLLKHDRVHATSDGHIFINSSADHIKSHAKANNVEIFTLKGEEISVKKKNEQHNI